MRGRSQILIKHWWIQAGLFIFPLILCELVLVEKHTAILPHFLTSSGTLYIRGILFGYFFIHFILSWILICFMYFSNSLFMESSYCFKRIADFSHMIKTGRSWKAFTAFNQKKGNVKVKKKYCFILFQKSHQFETN